MRMSVHAEPPSLPPSVEERARLPLSPPPRSEWSIPTLLLMASGVALLLALGLRLSQGAHGISGGFSEYERYAVIVALALGVMGIAGDLAERRA